jgi:uncharacterized membrane protein YccF (DUF307 family)
MRVIGNILWLALAGLWLALGYVLAGLLAFVLIVTIPFGIASFRLASFVIWPFGRTTVWRRNAGIWSVVPMGREIVPISSVASDPYGIPA